MAGRSREEGGNRKSGAERVLAELSAWTDEAFRSRVVDERDVAPDDGGEGKRGDGGWWRSLHHRLEGGAQVQKEALPEESEDEGAKIEVPAARAPLLVRHV